MSISTTGECVNITIGINKEDKPVITRISTEGLVSHMRVLLEEGMEVTSISYNGQCVFLGREKQSNGSGDDDNDKKKKKKKPSKKKKTMTHPFLDKKFKLEPGTSVVAVVMRPGAELPEEAAAGGWRASKELFLVRGVTVGSNNNKAMRKRNSQQHQHIEILVYSIESMADLEEDDDDAGDDYFDEYESVSSQGSSSDDDDDVDHYDDDHYKSDCSFSDEDAATEDSASTITEEDGSASGGCVQTFKPKRDSFAWRPPPLGVPDGGYWTTQKYVGRHTMVASLVGCFCLGFVGPMVLCCPFDERSVYVVDGRAYAESGKCVAFELEDY